MLGKTGLKVKLKLIEQAEWLHRMMGMRAAAQPRNKVIR